MKSYNNKVPEENRASSALKQLRRGSVIWYKLLHGRESEGNSQLCLRKFDSAEY